MLVSDGYPVQPPAETDQRPGSAEDAPDPAEPAPPPAQRPGVGKVADRLLDQRAQPRLATVERPLRVGEPVFATPVPDRGVPVLAGPCRSPKPAVEDGGHAAGVQDRIQPRQREEFVLVAAAGPAAVAPQAENRDQVGGPVAIPEDLLPEALPDRVGQSPRAHPPGCSALRASAR